MFFVTFWTLYRREIKPLNPAHEAFRTYALRGRDEFNIAVGRYVFMPDHVHLFVRGGPDFEIAKWINGLKRALSVMLERETSAPLWQPGFFDHVMRNDESYAQKWEYVRNNPVRHRLVTESDDWPYQGEIVSIDRV